MNSNSITIQRQSGATLIIALIILAALTILAVSMLRTTTLDERLVGNFMDRSRVFEAAEAALRGAEKSIDDVVLPVDALPGSNTAAIKVVEYNGQSNDWWVSRSDNWWQSNGRDYNGGLTGLDDPPRYVIEQYDFQCDELVSPNYQDCYVIYRITARATGGRNTHVHLQSLYAKRY